MNPVLRRLATFLLLLAVPLRVYAAVAMVFCGGLGETQHDIESVSALMQVQTSEVVRSQRHERGEESGSVMHDESDRDHADADPGDHRHGAGPDGAHQQVSCSACCCTGMIATAQYDWKPQSFATPATPSFVAIAVPHAVPQRLERPPRTILA